MRRALNSIDPRALQAFVTVYSTSLTTAAARLFGAGQSPDSQAVSALERGQGASLFDRDSRPPRANNAGCALLQLTTPLRAHALRVSARIGEISNAGNASARLGCADSFAADLFTLTSLMRGVLDQHIRRAAAACAAGPARQCPR